MSERGKGKDGNAVFVRDLRNTGTTFMPVIPEITNDTFEVIDNVGGKLLVATNHQRAQLAGASWSIRRIRRKRTGQTVLAEQPEPLQSAQTAGGKLFATYLEGCDDAGLRLQPRRQARERDRRCPDRAPPAGFGGDRDDTIVFYTFNSLNIPPTIYRYDIATKKSTVFRQPKVPGYDPTTYETSRSSTRARTAPRCRCSSSTRKG